LVLKQYTTFRKYPKNRENNMRLGLQLIPESAFYSNLRNALGPRSWSALSKKIREENSYTCKYCPFIEDRSRRLYTHLHEVWEFDITTKTQKLVDFECICPTCHSVHHWGLSRVQGKDMDYLLEHACEINNCTRQQFEEHIKKSFSTWRDLSYIKWSLDFSLFPDIKIP